jgi:hypothetical protein
MKSRLVTAIEVVGDVAVHVAALSQTVHSSKMDWTVKTVGSGMTEGGTNKMVDCIATSGRSFDLRRRA